MSTRRMSATRAAGPRVFLIGIAADPLRSREHVLLSQLLDRAWRDGKDVELAALVQGVMKPPFAQVGAFDLETFFPTADRTQLAHEVAAAGQRHVALVAQPACDDRDRTGQRCVVGAPQGAHGSSVPHRADGPAGADA